MPEINESVERGFILSIADAAADLRSARVAVSVAENDLEMAVLGMVAEIAGEDAAEWVRLRADTGAMLSHIGDLADAAVHTRDGMAVRGAILTLAADSNPKNDPEPVVQTQADESPNMENAKPKRRRGKK